MKKLIIFFSAAICLFSLSINNSHAKTRKSATKSHKIINYIFPDSVVYSCGRWELFMINKSSGFLYDANNNYTKYNLSLVSKKGTRIVLEAHQGNNHFRFDGNVVDSWLEDGILDVEIEEYKGKVTYTYDNYKHKKVERFHLYRMPE